MRRKANIKIRVVTTSMVAMYLPRAFAVKGPVQSISLDYCRHPAEARARGMKTESLRSRFFLTHYELQCFDSVFFDFQDEEPESVDLYFGPFGRQLTVMMQVSIPRWYPPTHPKDPIPFPG